MHTIVCDMGFENVCSYERSDSRLSSFDYRISSNPYKFLPDGLVTSTPRMHREAVLVRECASAGSSDVAEAVRC
jgi:hypothetical protein